MAPAVTRGRRKKGAAQQKDAVKDAPKQEVALMGESGAELRKMAQELHARIVAATPVTWPRADFEPYYQPKTTPVPDALDLSGK